MSRIERGIAPNVTVGDIFRLAGVVGLDVVLRAYPGGQPLRDRGHVGLLEQLRRRLHPSLGWRTEVPLARPGDPRAWDAVIIGAGPRLMVEAETRLTDLQALERRIALKSRDEQTDRVILLLADTRGNRIALRAAGHGLVARFPIDGRRALTSLGSGLDPGGGSVIVLSN